MNMIRIMVIIKLDPILFKVSPGILDEDVIIINVLNVIKLLLQILTMSLYRCDGRLYKINMDEEFKENHYRNLLQI